MAYQVGWSQALPFALVGQRRSRWDRQFRPDRAWYDREKNVRKRYGITQADYQVMFLRQNGQCGICLRPENRLHIDHCHSTGKVRGLLCKRCNRGIGLLADDPSLIRRAHEWLTR